MTITSQQFNKLATKSDLKKDLKKLEEKIDKKFATKDDLKKGLKELRQETKSDLDKFAARAFDMFASKDDIKELRQEMATKEDINKILTAVDGITKQYQEFNIGFAMNQGAHDRFEKKLLKQKKELELLKKN